MAKDKESLKMHYKAEQFYLYLNVSIMNNFTALLYFLSRFFFLFYLFVFMTIFFFISHIFEWSVNILFENNQKKENIKRIEC